MKPNPRNLIKATDSATDSEIEEPEKRESTLDVLGTDQTNSIEKKNMIGKSVPKMDVRRELSARSKTRRPIIRNNDSVPEQQ